MSLRIPDIKLHNLVKVNGRICGAHGKVTVGLALHYIHALIYFNYWSNDRSSRPAKGTEHQYTRHVAPFVERNCRVAPHFGGFFLNHHFLAATDPVRDAFIV